MDKVQKPSDSEYCLNLNELGPGAVSVILYAGYKQQHWWKLYLSTFTQITLLQR
jgi:hypothetical protein